MSSFAGGIRISTSNTSLYANENAGDVVIYTGSSNQTFYIGHSNVATPGLAMTSNLDVQFGKDITSRIVNATGSMVVHMGGISPVESDVNIQGTIAANSIAASNHTFLMGSISGVSKWTDISSLGSYSVTYGAASSTFSSNVIVAGNIEAGTMNIAEVAASNMKVGGYLTVGSNLNVDYPIHVQSVGLSNVSIMAEGDISALSDRRVKTAIEPISGALAKMDLIKGYTFNWVRDPNASRSAGVIAQELREVLPEVVTVDSTESAHLHVAYGNISALLIQAIKDLAHRTTAMVLTIAQPGETIDVALPDRKSLIGDAAAAPWRVAVISAAEDGADASAAFAAVSEDGSRLVGRCDVPGKYAVMVTC